MQHQQTPMPPLPPPPAPQLLDAAQEALLECESYPWCPDLYAITAALAEARGREELLGEDSLLLGDLLMGNDVLKVRGRGALLTGSGRPADGQRRAQGARPRGSAGWLWATC
jgi:hypothetical protein